jgi:hypothetical protein
MLLKRLQLVYLLLVLFLLSASFFHFFYLHPSDCNRYQKMLRKKALASSFGASYNPTEQQRTGVRKEIWLAAENQGRLHYRIESDHSLLTLTPVKNKFTLVESLQGMRCWIQEKVVENRQQLRYFEAAEGLYSYNKAELLAKEAKLSLYKLESSSLPQGPLSPTDAYLRGVARNVSVCFGGKIPQFKASEFKAILASSEDR